MSTLARVVYSPDTTPPTTPGSVTASALSQTAIRVSWAASTDTGGSGLAGYRVYRSTTSGGTYSQIGTDLTTASLSYDDTGLSAGTTLYYRIVAFDGNSNTSSQSSIASATTTSAASNNDGLIVTDFAQYDPDAATFMSLDVNSTLPNMNGFNGGIVTFENQSWWNGSSVGVCRMRPPTVDNSRSGLGGLLTGWPLWKNGTKSVRQLNFRIEAMFSDAFCLESTQYPKYFIFLLYDQLSPSAPDTNRRPMFFIAHGNQDSDLGVANSIVFSPATGTLRLYSSSNIVPAADAADRIASGDTDPGTFATMRQPFYIRSTSGSDSLGNPIIPTSEIICMEIRLQMMSTTDEPGGVVGFRVYRRNGQVFERCCALQWDTSYPVNTYYIGGIDSFGGGFYNNGQASSSNLWTMVGRRIGIAFNYLPTLGRAWIGPPTGFVTG